MSDDHEPPFWTRLLITIGMPGLVIAQWSGVVLLAIHDALFGYKPRVNELFLGWLVYGGTIFAILFWIAVIWGLCLLL